MQACLPAPLVPGTLVVLGVVLGPRPMLGGGSLCLVAGRLQRSINGLCPGGGVCGEVVAEKVKDWPHSGGGHHGVYVIEEGVQMQLVVHLG